MQKTSTANERHLSTLAYNHQQQPAVTPQHPPAVTTKTALNTAYPTASPSVSPALAPLTTDSPRSPSSQLSLTSSSQPPSPSSPTCSHDDGFSRSVSASDSASVVGGLPVTSAVARVRVPLSQVVTSLTSRWSMEYLVEAEAGDVDAQCLVAQMYLTGWGALKEDQAEGKRWLQRAKEAGIAGTVNKLELLYLGDSGGECAQAQTCGYYSGYQHTPQHSPSATPLASFMPTPKSSFFASVAATISPKPAVAPLNRSSSLSMLAAGAVAASGGGRLSVPSSERLAAVVSSGSSSSGDEQHHHAHHWRADRHMQLGRDHSSELGVSAS